MKAHSNSVWKRAEEPNLDGTPDYFLVMSDIRKIPHGIALDPWDQPIPNIDLYWKKYINPVTLTVTHFTFCKQGEYTLTLYNR